MRIHSVSLMVTFGLALLGITATDLAAREFSFKDFSKSQFAMNCFDEQGQAPRLVPMQNRRDLDLLDCLPTNCFSCPRWLQGTPQTLAELFSLDAIATRTLDAAKSSLITEPIQLAKWSEALGKSLASWNNSAERSTLIVHAPYAGRPPCPASKTSEFYFPPRTQLTHHFSGLIFDEGFLRDWRFGHFAIAADRFRIREAPGIVLDECDDSHLDLPCNDSPSINAFEWLLTSLDQFESQLANEIATLHRLADWTQEAATSSQAALRCAAVEMSNALRNWNSPQPGPFFVHPAYVEVEIPNGLRVVLTIEQARRWNIIRIADPCEISPRLPSKPLNDTTEEFVWKRIAANFKLTHSVPQTIDRHLKRYARQLFDQLSTQAAVCWSTAEELEPTFATLSHWMARVTIPRIAARNIPGLR